MKAFFLRLAALVLWVAAFHVVGYFLVDRYLDKTTAYLFSAGYTVLVIGSGVAIIYTLFTAPLAKKKGGDHEQ